MPPNPIYGAREKEFFGEFSLLWLESSEEHARHRQIVGRAFSDKSLREQEPILNKYVNLLMQRMQEHAGKTVDIASWFNFTTFDIIGDLTFGESFECLEKERLHPWVGLSSKILILSCLKARKY